MPATPIGPLPRSEACHFIMGSVCQLLEGPQLEALAPEIARKLGLGLRYGPPPPQA